MSEACHEKERVGNSAVLFVGREVRHKVGEGEEREKERKTVANEMAKVRALLVSTIASVRWPPLQWVDRLALPGRRVLKKGGGESEGMSTLLCVKLCARN